MMPLSDCFCKETEKVDFFLFPGRESGFFVDGDAKALAELSLKDGSSLILAAQNSDSLKIFKPLEQSYKSIRLKNNDVSAELIFKNGDKEYIEFNYGTGYLSQSSRVCRISEDVVSVKVTTYTGESRNVSIISK